MNLLSGLIGGGWEFFAGRLIPAFIAISLFALDVLPSVDLAFAREFSQLSVGAQTAILVLVAIVIGFVLDALETPLYALLEGYLWPRPLRKRGIAHQRKKRDRFLAAHGAPAEPADLDTGLLLEQSGRWPVLDEQIAPTRLGNRLRAFEVYGWVRFWGVRASLSPFRRSSGRSHRSAYEHGYRGVAPDAILVRGRDCEHGRLGACQSRTRPACAGTWAQASCDPQ